MRGNMPVSWVGDFKRYYVYARQCERSVWPTPVRDVIMLYLKIYSEGSKGGNV